MQNCNFLNSATDNSKDHLDFMPVIGLAIGMQVEQLDKPWIESSFLMQGFKIESDSDIQALRAECSHVYIERQDNMAGSSMARGKNAPTSFNWAGSPGGRIV